MPTKNWGTITELPSGRFRARYTTPDGRRVTAPSTFDTRRQAQTWLDVQRGKVLERTWVAAKPGAELKLDEYARTWLDQRTDLKPRTVDLYHGLLERHVLPTLGGHAIADLTPGMLRAWQAGLATGDTARAQSYRLLRAILNQAVRDGDLSTNPCTLRGAGSVQAPERVPPTIAEVEAVAAKMPPRYRMLVLVAAYGGLRLGELTAMTRADVGPGTVTVARAMHRIAGEWIVTGPKSDAGRRIVTLPASLIPDLAEHLELFVGAQPDALVFGTASGRPLAKSNVSAMLHRAQLRAKVPPFRFHDLRHAGATLALQTGATTKDVMARIGHSSPRAAMIYAHTARDRDEAIAAALDVARQAAGTSTPDQSQPSDRDATR